MRCEEFDALRALREPQEAHFEHARSCPDCQRRLDVARAIRDLPRTKCPPEVDARLVGAATRMRHVRALVRVVRVAAAAVLIAGVAAGTWVAIPSWGTHHRPRLVRAVLENGPGPGAAASGLEEIFGPETPIQTASGGGAHGATRR